MRTVALFALTLLACENDSDERDRRPPTTVFPGGQSTSSTGSKMTSASSGGNASSGSGTGGEGGGGTSSASTGGPSVLEPICTCVWNLTHADFVQCNDCRTTAQGNLCNNAFLECEADALCNQLVTTVLENCPGSPNFACIDDALGFPSMSRTLAENLLVCLCDSCNTECDDDPQCM